IPQAWSLPGAIIDLVRQDDTHRQRAGMRLHQRTLDDRDLVVVQGLACLSETRTLVELARDVRLPARLVIQIIDGALRDSRVTREELHACLARFPGERFV